jgi:D-erythro-7,8-dihydroneopterin triphosphate epimerase
MALIRIVDLKVKAIIGTHPRERAKKQDLVLNIVMEYNADKAAESDEIKDALDYEDVVFKVTEVIDRSRCLLLEKLAAMVLDVLISCKQVKSAVVQIDKPNALAKARAVSYETSAKKISN